MHVRVSHRWQVQELQPATEEEIPSLLLELISVLPVLSKYTHTARAQHGEIVLLPVGSDSVMVRLVTVAQAQSHVAKH